MATAARRSVYSVPGSLAAPGGAELADEAAVELEHLHPVVLGVGDVHQLLAQTGSTARSHAVGGAELAVAGAGGAPGVQARPRAALNTLMVFGGSSAT